jgi:CRISPR-associated protein Csd1
VLDDKSPFFALALSGEMARAKVRGWYETTLGRALQNVKTHFDDVEIVRRNPDPLPLWRLLNSTALLGERKYLEPGLAAATFGAVIDGRAYPRSLLQGAVRRARAAREVTPERASLIKAYLSRARRKGLLPAFFPEVTSHMDTASTNVPYRLGRLFATLEKLQEEALPGTNATIRDRFFGAASATPVTVFPRLVRGAQPHLGKVKRSVYFEKLIQAIVEPVVRFPSHLNLEEQGLFTLGYYHQRQDFFTKKDDAANAA